MLGIYCYIDKKDNKIVYIGKDSKIDKDVRRYAHRSPSQYKDQPFNRVLQNNPNRYTYQVLVWDVKDQDTLNALEIQYIRQLKPKFNFTDGGDGCVGRKHSEETKRKIRESQIGNKRQEHSEITKAKISKSNKGKKRTAETKFNISKSLNKTGFVYVDKFTKKYAPNGYAFRYRYRDEDNKIHSITSVDIFTLKQKVEDKKLNWSIIDIDNAINTIREEVRTI